jgi:hypothetical protein
MPTLDIMEANVHIYFLATKKGVDLQVSDYSWWPHPEPSDD